MDKYTREVRAKMMSSVRSKGNKSTEKRLRALLVRYEIKGWSLQASRLKGKPDFTFDREKVVVFADGCFWHGCSKCGRVPSSRTEYWIPKIKKNRLRDKKTKRELEANGWVVIRIWEHDILNNSKYVIGRLKKTLASRELY